MNIDPKAPSTEQVDSLLAEWKKDSAMDKLEPANELRKIGSLHSKYLSILSSHRRALKEAERRMAKLRKLKYEYYMGRLDQTTLAKYGWQPFLYTLKGDLNTYMESDNELLNGKAVMAIHEEVMDIAERIIKELGSRTFQLKDIISWEKFISGAH
jgi:hypothetical protein